MCASLLAPLESDDAPKSTKTYKILAFRMEFHHFDYNIIKHHDLFVKQVYLSFKYKLTQEHQSSQKQKQ